ncbi:DUF3310 domain-containing protein [Alistipes finegoldii]|jgi:hypothetical protein|uniref:DUF3310 domain-containing protein n=1 Tax=Alistipes finegoldii TaxID=214856 RepID=UPI00204A8752|nr:MAG TPA: nucelotide kinase [Caudoviricetes sp.]
MDEEKTDMVNHPSHYTACSIVLEPVDATELLPHPLASAVEYILRSPYKGSEKQDLEKAVWWLMRFRDETMPRLHYYDGVYKLDETAGVYLWVFCREHPLLRGLCKLRPDGFVVEADVITNVAKSINARISRLSSQEVPHV